MHFPFHSLVIEGLIDFIAGILSDVKHQHRPEPDRAASMPHGNSWLRCLVAIVVDLTLLALIADAFYFGARYMMSASA